MTITYTFNKNWTWKKNDKSNKRVLKFSILYSFSLLLNVITNSQLLTTLYKNESFINLPYKYFIAFIGATGMSTILNFLGQKFWIFKS